MENCLYRGKVICTFELKDQNGFYYEDIVLGWKEAAAERALTCIECGAPVYLAAGPIKEPYFAYYDLKQCDYGNGQESEELKKGKRLLYQLVKRSNPDGEIYARHRMENGMYSTIYSIFPDGKEIALDYRLINNSLEKFKFRNDYYLEHNITPIYVLGMKQRKDTMQIDWYQSLLQNIMGYLIFLDTQKETITLKKSFSYRLGTDRKFAYCIKEYQSKELGLNAEGVINCDFWDNCNEMEQKIIAEKEDYEKRKEESEKLKQLYLEMQEKEKERMEQYRKAEQERNLNNITNPFMGTQQGNNDKVMITSEHKIISELNPVVLEKCRKMIEEGNAHLVSEKYYNAIMGSVERQE